MVRTKEKKRQNGRPKCPGAPKKPSTTLKRNDNNRLKVKRRLTYDSDVEKEWRSDIVVTEIEDEDDLFSSFVCSAKAVEQEKAMEQDAGIYRVRVKHAMKGYVDDNVVVGKNRFGEFLTPSAVFGKHFGYVVRKVLYRSFNRFHPSMENGMVELDVADSIPAAFVCGQPHGKDYFQVFLSAQPYRDVFSW